MRCLIATFLAIPLLACGDDGGSADGDSGPGCAGGGLCAPSVPSGWEGPVAVAVASSAGSLPSCDDIGGTQFAIAGDGLTGPPAVCNCQCNSTGCSAELTFDNDGNCQNTETTPASPGECVVVPAGIAAFGVTTEGQCEPDPGETELPPLTGGAGTLVCSGLESMASCGGGSCVPGGSGFRDVACVARDGDQDCPDGYPDKEVVNTLNDGRTCSECSCPSGLTDCPGTMALFTDETCSTVAPGISPPAEGCVGANSIDGVRFEPGAEGCPPIGGEPMGEVTQGDEMTICCAS